MSEAIKLTKYVYTDKYEYTGYGTRFDARSQSSLPIGEWGNIVINVDVDNSSSTHTVNKKKDHLILGEVSTYGLEDTKLTTQAKYPVKIIKARKNIVSVYTTMQPTVCCMLMM